MSSGIFACGLPRVVLAFACLAVVPGLTGPAAAQPLPANATPANASGVQAAADTALAGDRTRTRFVIGLERPIDFQVFSLANPNRVIVEMPDVKLQLPTLPGGAPVGLVRSFFGGVSAPGKQRVVIDVTSAVVVEKATLEKAVAGKAPRLVLEIVPVDAGNKTAQQKRPFVGAAVAGLGASGVQPPVPKPALRPVQKAIGVYKPIVVIDPGHGGHDSGAVKNGAVEKEVVLAFSLKLRDKLNATGRYKVLMTRETDSFVELDTRRDFGDKHKAALFIAVHADYAGSGARGATIYSLREGTSKELQRSIRGESSDSLLTPVELDNIRKSEGDVSSVRSFLSDLVSREHAVNKERSNLFTRSVIEYMGASTSMMSNPDREANFRVLKSAKTPSVLIELAYVTNVQDAQNLKSDTWRDKVTGSIMTAIDNYFSHQTARLPM